MDKKIIAFNWKMNPPTIKEAKSLFERVRINISKNPTSADIIILPPFTYLFGLGSINRTGVKMGAQDVFWENNGAYTGEISPKMLKNSGAKYVIIGHSERRKLGESDEMINKKVLSALKAGLKVILCVGEKLKPTTNNPQPTTKTKQFIKNQLKKNLKDIHNSLFMIHDSLIVAYEPVWAIGTGKNATPEYAVEMAIFIKSIVKGQMSIVPKVLYGGSVNSKNISGFINQPEVDGVLVGGASADKKEFSKLLNRLKGRNGNKKKN